MTRDRLAWDGPNPPIVRTEKRRILAHAIATGLLVFGALIFGLYGR